MFKNGILKMSKLPIMQF